ncbi:MAG: GH92 family glycosyl hydrolase [Oscillospiraceae bacterium]|jgi:predicted alpha-1,2-mannosidase|nr:GH92 family glycosyl hydrolase [Oscillospiraceae bacterium]
MSNLFRCAVSLFSSLSIFLTSFFTTGSLPKSRPLPATPTGTYGQWVDPFIGTGGIPWASAMLFPGPTAPFGLVRLSPDTCFPFGVDLFRMADAGYHTAQTHLLGFSHTRLSGTGFRDLGHFRVTPAAGKPDPSKRLRNPLPFSHDQETATAGYYAVQLPTIDCLAELTATDHVGVHRYTFYGAKDAHLLIDATSFLLSGRAEDGKVTVLPDSREVVGEGRVFTDASSRYGGLKGYFVARFDRPLDSYATWNADGSVLGRAESAGNDAGADLNFGSIPGQTVTLQVGISFVSLENARENLEAEAGAGAQVQSFDQIRAAAQANWDGWLSRIQTESGDDTVKTIFYTALYHSMIMPSNFTDVNGEYLGFGEEIGTADGFTYRTDMSLWDTFRTTHPLYLLIAPEIQRDSLKSLVRMARTGGALPRWPSGSGETGSMFGSPANMLISESYLKGLRDFEFGEAYEFMKKASDGPVPSSGRDKIEEYNQYGYIPNEARNRSVSYTLEYAWADNSIALLADALGKPDEAAVYQAKAANYKNLFDPETKYFRPRAADGTWQDFSPYITTFYNDILPIKRLAYGYDEGSARQWRWSVQQDPQELIRLLGGKDNFVKELNQFMQDAARSRAAIDPGSGYWQGNQHDIHAIYLFNDAGRPDLAQKWVRWALTERHSTDDDGLDGNDDGGTLSAWYVWSAIGLYPVAGSDRYWIGAPILGKATLNLGGGKVLTITAANQSAKNCYVQSVTLDGVRLTEPFLTHSQIADGGTLAFVMGPNSAAGGGYGS